jgi:hypothetical protein
MGKCFGWVVDCFSWGFDRDGEEEIQGPYKRGVFYCMMCVIYCII